MRGMMTQMVKNGELDEETANRAEEIQYSIHSAPNAHKGIPLELLITLRKKGLSYDSIARVVGCSDANVKDRLRGLDSEIRMASEYVKNRADVLSFHQRRILNSISKRNLQKASLKDKAVSFGVLFDKEKIETNKLLGGSKLVIALINYHDNKTQIVDISGSIPAQITEEPTDRPTE